MSTTPQTFIEIRDQDHRDRPVGHVAKQVYINGSPVLVAEDGVHIKYGPDEMTTVTLDLLPTELHFGHGPTP